MKDRMKKEKKELSLSSALITVVIIITCGPDSSGFRTVVLDQKH